MENYVDLKRFIGSGAFGTCHLYERKQNQARVVIKKVPVSADSADSLQKEVDLLRDLHHPFIVRFVEAFVNHGSLCIVTYYAQGGTLATLIQECVDYNTPLERHSILLYFTQIAMALDYLHSKSVAHRDLKPENIFLNARKTIIKVADFGISKNLNNSAECTTRGIGTLSYIAPEAINRKRSHCDVVISGSSRRRVKPIIDLSNTSGSQSTDRTKSGRNFLDHCDLKSDLWSLGCILYELIELRKAFPARSELEVVKKISECKYLTRKTLDNDDIFAIVAELLVIDPSYRTKTSDLLIRPIIVDKVVFVTTNPLTLPLGLYKK